MTTIPPTADWRTDQPFFVRMAIGLSVFIVFAFAQWAMRGMVDFAAVPVWVHLHGIVHLGWLALFVTQSVLAGRGAIALHRRLGWLALVLMPLVVALTVFTGYMAVVLGRVPPFYGNAQFLALTSAEAIAFGALVVAALLRRRETQWHRRLMLLAAVVLVAPALGRTLPMPVLGHWGPLVMTTLQLCVAGLGMLHDRRTSGRVHPAYFWGAGVLVAILVIEQALMRMPAFVAFAEAIAAGG